MEFSPHTERDVEQMLATLGLSDLDELFAHIPANLRPAEALDLPDGVSEDEILRELRGLADRNHIDAVCFAGGGAYDHHVPAVVAATLARGELLTSYTPYQPEVSQGMLQALFEYQTAISELTGLEVSNASMYDGGSAVAEAVSMACAATRRDGVVVSGGLDAPSRRIVATYAHPQRRAVETRSLDADGRTPVAAVADDTAVLVISQPNALGVVEDIAAHAEAAHTAGAQLIVKFDASTAGLLATPGSQGADLCVGEGQPLGQGLAYGGPTFGFLACTTEHVRRVPGRMVGRTVDVEGRVGYVMTLRAREQDIRRERATSNICTNQTLNAVAALVYLAWLGPRGLAQLGRICLARARHAAERLSAIDGVELATDGPFVKEFPVYLGDVDPHAAVARLHADGYLVGPVVADGPAAGSVVVAVTERRTREEVEGLADAVARLVKEGV